MQKLHAMPLYLVMPISSAWHELVRHGWSESHPHGSTSESGNFTVIHSEAAERQEHRIVDKDNLCGLLGSGHCNVSHTGV